MRALRACAKALVTTIIFFVVIEVGLRAAYGVRNRLVTYIPLPYVVGDSYGPIPPWLDSLLILRPDPTLIWKNIPNARRAYVDIFTPVRSDADHVRRSCCFAAGLSLPSPSSLDPASIEGDAERDRKSTRLNSSHVSESRMPSSA